MTLAKKSKLFLKRHLTMMFLLVTYVEFNLLDIRLTDREDTIATLPMKIC